MDQNQKKYIILGSLCALVLTLAVGYAAFSSILNIKGISNINSNWDVRIIGITSNAISGNPTNAEEPTYDNINGLSATFKTDLESPGDIMEYVITVKNQGSINAKLDKITLTDSTSNAIKFTTTGIQEGETLKTGESKELKVKVEYLTGVALDKNNMSANLTVTLYYSQLNVNDEGIAIPPFSPTELTNNVVTTGDGLYANGDNRYVYKGATPNNYIEFNGEIWRIIALEPDGTLKIIKNDSISVMAYDNAKDRYSTISTDYCTSEWGCKVWGSKTTTMNWSEENITAIPLEIYKTGYNLPDKEASLNIYLNSEYYNSLNETSKNLISNNIWKIGLITGGNDESISVALSRESWHKWRGNIGLINATDYIIASLDSGCTNYYDGGQSSSPCKNSNYLFNGETYFTITSLYGVKPNNSVIVVHTSGSFQAWGAYGTANIRPTVYLKSNITLSGKGTEEEPYTINQ